MRRRCPPTRRPVRARAGVHPDEVALPVGGVAKAGRERHVAGGRPRPVGDGTGHGLEDGIDHRNGDAEFTGPTQERGRQVGPVGAGSQFGPNVEHGHLVDPLGGRDAGQLVGGLADRGGSQDRAGVGASGERRLTGAQHRPGPAVDRDLPRGEVAEHLVEDGSQCPGTFVVVGRRSRVGDHIQPIGFPADEVGAILVGPDDCHGPSKICN